MYNIFLAVDSAGALYISDTVNGRIRKVVNPDCSYTLPSASANHDGGRRGGKRSGNCGVVVVYVGGHGIRFGALDHHYLGSELHGQCDGHLLRRLERGNFQPHRLDDDCRADLLDYSGGQRQCGSHDH